MPTRRISIPTIAAAVVVVAAGVAAAPASAADSLVSTPIAKTLYKTGPSGRYLMNGPWLFRTDPPGGDGVRLRFQRSASTAGWTRITVPNAWNATDESVQSFLGGVG